MLPNSSDDYLSVLLEKRDNTRLANLYRVIAFAISPFKQEARSSLHRFLLVTGGGASSDQLWEWDCYVERAADFESLRFLPEEVQARVRERIKAYDKKWKREGTLLCPKVDEAEESE